MKLMTRQETADHLRISVRTLTRLEAAGKMPPRVQISPQRFVYREVDIMGLLAGKTGERPQVSSDGVFWPQLAVVAEIDRG